MPVAAEPVSRLFTVYHEPCRPNANLSMKLPVSRPPIDRICVRLPSGTVQVAGPAKPVILNHLNTLVVAGPPLRTVSAGAVKPPPSTWLISTHWLVPTLSPKPLPTIEAVVAAAHRDRRESARTGHNLPAAGNVTE